MDNHQIQIILESIDNKLDILIESQASLGLQMEDWIREASAGLSRSKAAILVYLSQKSAN